MVSWFCSKYKHVVAFDTEERTGGVKIEEDDMAEGKGHQVASLIELLNLGKTQSRSEATSWNKNNHGRNLSIIVASNAAAISQSSPRNSNSFIGSTDFVIGNMESGFALLGRWLSDQNIVRNVLKQQKMAGRIKRKSGISIWEQDFNQCSFKVDRE